MGNGCGESWFKSTGCSLLLLPVAVGAVVHQDRFVGGGEVEVVLVRTSNGRAKGLVFNFSAYVKIYLDFSATAFKFTVW